MTEIKPSDHGIVVEHKVSGIRFATSDAAYDKNTQRKVRDLRPGESIYTYVAKLHTPTSEEDEETPTVGDTSVDDTSATQ